MSGLSVCAMPYRSVALRAIIVLQSCTDRVIVDGVGAEGAIAFGIKQPIHCESGVVSPQCSVSLNEYAEDEPGQ